MKIKESEIYYHHLNSPTGWIRKLGIFFLVLLLLTSCQENDEPAPDNMGGPTEMEGEDEESKVAPDFELTSLGGTQVKLSDQRDKVVVLFFFGFNCGLCRSAAPGIEQRINAAYATNANFAMFGLDQWNGNAAGVEGFKNTTGVTFPLLLDAAATARDYGTTYDRLIVVDQEGNIAYQANMNATNSVSTVVSTVQALLSK